jgi:hypothetical protein
MYITIIFWTMILVPMLLYQNWFSKPHQFSNHVHNDGKKDV